MQITVAFVNQPNKNPKFGSIKSITGTFYDISANQLHKYRAGQSFDAPVKEREYQGKTYYSIPDSFDPASAPTSIPTSTPAPTSNGHANGNATVFRTPGEMFVSECLAAAIRSGKFDTQDYILVAMALTETWRQIKSKL